MAQFMNSSVDPQRNILVPQEAWDSAVRYSIGSYVYHTGGIWIAETRSLDSEPISGNADWTLAGGAPYVDVVLGPDEILSSPFYDPGNIGPGYLALSRDTTGTIVRPTAVECCASDGDDWGDNADLQVYWTDIANGVDAVGTPFGRDPELPLAPGSSAPVTVATTATFPTGLGIPIVDQDLYIGIHSDPSVGGLTFGTRGVRIRIFYEIIQPVSINSFFRISAVNQGTKTLTVDQSPVSVITPPETFAIVGSTGLDGTYTALAVTATTIRVKETLPSATGDGWVEAS